VAEAQPVEISFDNLREALRESNPEVINAGLQMRSDEAAVTGLGAAFLPSFSSQIDKGKVGSESTSTVEVESSINVYRGGSDKSDAALSRTKLDLSSLGTQATLLDVLRLTRQIYLEIVGTSERVRIHTALRENLESMRAPLLKRLAAGLATNSDLLRLNTALANNDLHITTFELRRAQLQTELQLGLGNADITFAAESLGALHQKYKPTDQNGAPGELSIGAKMLEFEATMHQLEAQKAQGPDKPRIDVFAKSSSISNSNSGTGYSAPHHEVGIRLSLDLATSARERKSAAGSLAREALVRSRLSQHQPSLTQRIAATKNELAQLSSGIDKIRAAADSMKDLRKSLTKEYASGLKEFAEVLEAHREEAEVYESVVEAQEHYLTKWSDLMRLLDK